jgi:ATP-dependent DNA helicase RecQ
MHQLQSSYDAPDHISLDLLSDLAGISITQLPTRINLLQKAGVCRYQIPVTVLVTKGVRGDTRRNYERIQKIATEFLETILEVDNDQGFMALPESRCRSISNVIEG